jgi:hypothetical protein
VFSWRDQGEVGVGADTALTGKEMSNLMKMAIVENTFPFGNENRQNANLPFGKDATVLS